MKKRSLPTISIVIATFNAGRTIRRVLESIRLQVYPTQLVEVIIVDGGSNDDTKRIAREYSVRWFTVPPDKQNAEYNKSVGIGKARNEIVAMIDHDNVLPHKMWLQNMVAPLVEHKEVVAVETLRYHYDPKSSLVDRYFALFGAGDPIVWYLGKADRLSYIYDDYVLAGRARDYGDYYIVQFHAQNMPTIGANGFLVRRRELVENAQTAPGKYFDMDVNIDLINKGFHTYAFVKDSILHLTGYGSVWYFLKRRMLFMTQYHLGEKGLAMKKVRRYAVFSEREVLRLVWIIVICLTLVIPIYDSIRGWRKIHDTAWFLHPFLCLSFVVLYGLVILRHTFYGYAKRFLEK